MSKFIFALDAGHGGQDSGATGGGLKEKDLVLDISKRVERYLAKNYPDIDCRMTRDDDTFVALSQRSSRSNNWQSDCFVSIHINAFADDSANGFESFVYTTDDETTKSYALQKKLHEKVAPLWTGEGRKDRGMKKANFHVVREFKGASVLLELGFISNAKDRKLLSSPSFLQKNAEAIGDAVADYLGVTKRVTAGSNIYRVKVDGNQVGAYAEPNNIARQVEQAVRSGKSSVVISKV